LYFDELVLISLLLAMLFLVEIYAHCTLCLKKASLTLLVVTWRRIIGFQQFLVQVFLT